MIELTESWIREIISMQNFIPHYLGRMVLYLQPQELDELIEDTFYKRVNGTSEKAAVYTCIRLGRFLKITAVTGGVIKHQRLMNSAKKYCLDI